MWTFPGFSSPAFLIGLFAVGYGGMSYQDLVAWGVIILFPLLVLGCGIFDGILTLTRKFGREQITPARLAGHVGCFCAMQIALVPLLGMATISACNVIFSH